jgi:hypothetical protein
MSRDRLLYTRAAKVRLDMLPVEVRVLMEATPERLPTMLERSEDGFVTTAQGVRVLFTLDTSARTLLVHRVESFQGTVWGAAPACALPEVDAN